MSKHQEHREFDLMIKEAQAKHKQLRETDNVDFFSEMRRRMLWSRAKKMTKEEVDRLAEILPPITHTTIKLIKARSSQSVSGRTSGLRRSDKKSKDSATLKWLKHFKVADVFELAKSYRFKKMFDHPDFGRKKSFFFMCNMLILVTDTGSYGWEEPEGDCIWHSILPLIE